MQQKLSFTKSLTVSKALSALPPLLWTLSWVEGKLPWAPSCTVCAWPTAISEAYLVATGVASRCPGGRGESVHIPCRGDGCRPVFPQHPLSWDSCQPSSWEFQRPSRVFFSRPHPKRRSLIYYIIVEKEFGGKLEYFNRWFHHHSSWTRARHLCLEHTKWLNTGSISQALGTPGQARPAAFPPYSSRVTSVSGNFKSTTGRMNKYLVTSLIMWIATELILLCKKTKTLCRYFSYKLM